MSEPVNAESTIPGGVGVLGTNSTLGLVGEPSIGVKGIGALGNLGEPISIPSPIPGGPPIDITPFVPGGIGVQGIGAIGIYGIGTVAGKFEGSVEVAGPVSVNGRISVVEGNAEVVCDTGAGASAVLGDNRGNGIGVVGRSLNGRGVDGHSVGASGVAGESDKNTGVFGVSHAANEAGVEGNNDGTGPGIVGRSQSGIAVFGKGGRLAGRFEGDVEVTGDIRLANADCAEDFDIAGAESIEPGTVMVLDQDGALRPSQQAYDKKVAGVISGAGGYKPAIVLDKQQSQGNRMPIALMGKVYCKVDAQYGAIEVGDLLTTSATLGHGMKANDPLKAFGAVIGKALRRLREGQGLIPILIALQ